MKKIISLTAFLIACLFVCDIAAQTTTQSPTGFQSVNWNMSAGNLTECFPGKLSKSKNAAGDVLYVMKDFGFGGQNYNVSFTMSGVDELESIRIFRFDEFPDPKAGGVLIDFMKEKYGEFELSKREEQGITLIKALFRTRDSNIKVEWFLTNGKCLTSITYSMW